MYCLLQHNLIYKCSTSMSYKGKKQFHHRIELHTLLKRGQVNEIGTAVNTHGKYVSSHPFLGLKLDLCMISMCRNDCHIKND